METNNTILKESPKRPKIIVWSLIMAIIIVTNLFFNYTISLLYTAPVYDKFCPVDIYNKNYDTKNVCLANGGMWSENFVPAESVVKGKNSPVITGYCNSTYTCQKNYDAARNIYERNVFIVLVILGVVIILIGTFVKVSLLSIAFSWSGVISLFIASVRYWSSAENLIRVLILGFALVVLIWLAVKKFNK